MKYEVITVPTKLSYKYDGPFSTFNGEPFARLTEDAKYIIRRTDVNRNFMISVPKGFVTDFGTIPKWAQWAINARGLGEKAYVLHDWLCFTGMCDYNTADSILYSAMRICGVSLHQCLIVRTALYIYHGFIEKDFSTSTTGSLGLGYQEQEYIKLPPYTPIPDLF